MPLPPRMVTAGRSSSPKSWPCDRWPPTAIWVSGDSADAPIEAPTRANTWVRPPASCATCTWTAGSPRYRRSPPRPDSVGPLVHLVEAQQRQLEPTAPGQAPDLELEHLGRLPV